MRELEREDLQWILRLAPKPVLELMKSNPDLILAGGFIRSLVAREKPNDIDLFLKDPTKAEGLAKSLGAVTSTANAHSVRVGKLLVQIIFRWTYPDPASLLESFDFTIAKAAIWWSEGWRSACDDRFYTDLASKRLRYTSPARNEDAGGSMLRVLKFYQRDYRIPLDSLGAIIARVNKGIQGIGTLDESRMATVITGLLREVDPNIDPSHIAHLPSSLSELETESDG